MLGAKWKIVSTIEILVELRDAAKGIGGKGK